MQQVFIERRIASKADLAQAVARTTVVDQLDIGNASLGVDRQALADEAATEKPVARGLVLDQALGVFVVAMVEHRA
ncbi:hypothetical protein D3C77_620620 [compost metagenome]